MSRLILSIALLFVMLPATAEEGFSSQFESLNGWRLVNFEEDLDPTRFELVGDQNRKFLRVVADGSASMIVREEPINVHETPVISWRWRLTDPLESADIDSIRREDTAIRILVTFRRPLEELPWWLQLWSERQLALHGDRPPSSAINYVWATRQEPGETIRSMWSRRIQFVVMNSGTEAAGVWQEHRVNVAEDYRRILGDEPPAEAFVAVMGDADDTGERAEAWLEYLRVGAE